MYAVSDSSRIYNAVLLFLCATFFLAPSVNASVFDPTGYDSGYWSTNERRFISQPEVNRRVQGILDRGVKRPVDSSIIGGGSPTVAKNPLGGLSSTTQSVIKTMGHPSAFNATLNNTLDAARGALKSCVRSPACATRALGTGAILYEGIKAWKDVYEWSLDAQGMPAKQSPLPVPPDNPNGTCVYAVGSNNVATYESCEAAKPIIQTMMCSGSNPECPISFVQQGAQISIRNRDGNNIGALLPIVGSCPYGSTLTFEGCLSDTEKELKPAPLADIDESIDLLYNPEASDAPLVLMSGEPESITLTVPPSAELPTTTTTNTDSNGLITTTITNKTVNYNVVNNNTSSPTINSTMTETTSSYDTSGNLTGTSNSTTNSSGVQADFSSPSSSSSPEGELNLELPAFCSWASIVCDWIGWTTEPLEYDDPDLTVLISDFEPDDSSFNLGIGSGTCPAPISLNLAFIGQTVEVSYQPFCDFVAMIRPFILAAAYLFSAYLYIGVLKRG